MKFTYIKLKNYIGIYQGCYLKDIYIDFTKSKNRICIIKADNGGGKSTLMKALNPFPDPNDMFIPEEEAYKEIGICDNDILYVIRCDHPVNKDGTRGQARAYIKKQGPNGFIELNTTGTIRSFKDVVDAEFGLDPNFVALSSLSTEDKGLVDKTFTERKKFVNSIISDVEAYNNINKVLTKRNSINKGIMNNLSSKIENIGNEENLKAALISIENRILGLEQTKDVLQAKIVECDSKIQIMDPNYEIQNLDTSIRVELESIETELRKLLENLKYIFDNNPQFNSEDYNTIEKCNALYYEYKTKIDGLVTKNKELSETISNMIVSREEESKALILKTQRLESLQSEYNYIDLEESIKAYKHDIAEYEKFFEQAHISNALCITKDEYILGLNTLKDIKDMIDSFSSYSFNVVIETSVNYIMNMQDPVHIYNELDKELVNYKSQLYEREKEYSYMEGMLEKSKQLEKRPSKCKIDSCPFINELINANNLNPQQRIDELSSELCELRGAISALQKELDIADQCINAVRDIKIILRSIDNNAAIISKLPNGNIFTDHNEVLLRIKDGSPFNEISELYQYINYANIFEEYKIATDTLYKLEVDYKIYESKNEIINELMKDTEIIQSKLNTIISDIESINKQIEANQSIINSSEDHFNMIDTIVSILTKIKDLKIKKEDCETRKKTISSNMEKISVLLVDKENYTNELFRVKTELDPLLKDRDSMKYSLKMLKQYQEEYEQISTSFNTIEVLKKYSTPSKKGIQNIFIKLYMNQSLNLANQILSLFFDGKMVLTNFIIGEEGFSIPAISMYTGLPVDDIKSCSRSEKTMASLALSAAMFKQSSTKFNIFKLDEIDEGLDAKNRLMYIEALNTILDILEVEQCIIVSHSSELSLGNVDIIKLKISNENVIANEGNIIFKL